jgi:hypothetical protein
MGIVTLYLSNVMEPSSQKPKFVKYWRKNKNGGIAASVFYSAISSSLAKPSRRVGE